MKMPSISSVEWDFRSIPEEVASDAYRYECLRSNETARDALTSLLNSKIRSSAGEWSEKTFREALVAEGLGDIDVFERTMKEFSSEIRMRALKLISKYPSFPEPFVVTSMTPLDQDAPIVPFQVFDGRPPFGAKAFRVDERASTPKVMQAFRNWIEENCDLADGRGIKHGRFVEKLKALSAYRLRKSGFSWNEASDHLGKFAATAPLSTGDYALPNYDSPSSWSKAVKKAKIDVETCFN